MIGLAQIKTRVTPTYVMLLIDQVLLKANPVETVIIVSQKLFVGSTTGLAATMRDVDIPMPAVNAIHRVIVSTLVE